MINLRVGPDALEVVDEHGGVLLRYVHGPALWKPYIQSLRVPGGRELLDDAPSDHPHHHGLWFGHGRIEAGGRMHDCWLEKPGCGRIVHAGLAAEADRFSAEATWLSADGAILARDRRHFTVATTPDTLTLGVEYALEGEGVRLHGSNEAGLPHLRPAPWIAARGGGAARDSEGRTGEKGIFGQPAAWVDYSGDGGGLRLIDDPANLGRPTRWFVRDYGPFSPNDGFFDPEPRPLPIRVRFTVVAHW